MFFFTGILGFYFYLLSVQCPGGVCLLRIVFLVVTALWSSGMPMSFASKAKGSKDVPCVDCMCSAALARLLGSVADGARSLASERQLSSHSQEVGEWCDHCTCGLQQGRGTVSPPFTLPAQLGSWCCIQAHQPVLAR